MFFELIPIGFIQHKGDNMNHTKQYAIFSVCKGNDINEDANNTDHIEYMMKQLKVPFKHLVGVYEGQAEASFLTTNLDFARTAAEDFNQECILVSDANGACYLERDGVSIQELGTMVSVSEAEAKETQNYSVDKFGNHYVTKKTA